LNKLIIQALTEQVLSMILTIEEAAARRDRAIKAAHELYERRVAEIEAQSVRVREPRGRNWDRYLRAVAMRNAGSTLKAIAEDQGVSVERIRQMIALLARRARNANYKPSSREEVAFWTKVHELNVDFSKF
jgi:hypothetical protein